MNMALVADMVLNLQHSLLQSDFPPKTFMQTLQLDAPK